MGDDRPGEPWLSFLTELDGMIEGQANFHCIGGFVVSQHFGSARETADLDVLTVIPPEVGRRVAELAGRGLELERKHRVYIDPVGVANYPDDYESRLVSVLERSNDRDIRDVIYLAEAGFIDAATLLSRFEQEYEPYVTGRTPTWNRSTLDMWVNTCWPK